jgi:hypothetical protein
MALPMAAESEGRKDTGHSAGPTAGEIRLELENADLRQLLAQAGIDAAQHDLAEKLQSVVLCAGSGASALGN